MSLHFGYIYIPTSDSRKLFKFLTSIFDVEVAEDYAGRLFVEITGQKFYPQKQSFVSESDISHFSFHVFAMEDLLNIQQKIEFYFYKEGLSTCDAQLRDNKLIFSDLDGNQWMIEYIPSLEKVKVPDQISLHL